MRFVKTLSILTAFIFSQSAMAQSAQDPPRALYQTPLGVSLLDLGYVYSNVDLKIGSLSLERSYASQRFTSNEYFDWGWTHNWDMSIRSSILHNQWHTDVFLGMSIYKFDGSLSLNAPSNDEAGTSVAIVNGQPNFTDRDGTVYRFLPLSGSVAKISSITRPGGEVIDFFYAAGLLKYLTSNSGYALLFDYNGSRVSAACGFSLSQAYVSVGTTCASATLKTTYTYTGTNLTSFYNVSGNMATLKYDYNSGAHTYLTCVTDPGSSVCPITNIYANHPPAIQTVVQQNLADGTIWHYTCTCGDEGRLDPDNLNPPDTSGITNPAGVVSGVSFIAGKPVSINDGSGNIRRWVFYGRFPVQVTEPEGNLSWVSYNDRMVPSANISQAKPGTGLPNIVSGLKTFPSTCANPVTCNEPLTVADAKGNVTNYAYDQTHGGVLSTMAPAPVAGAPRPLKLYAYVQKYAYIKNAGGSLVAAATPIWVPDTETLCQTIAGSSATTCDSGAPITITSFEYGANGTADNLLVRGKVVTSGGVGLRTCFGYDSQGNKIWETSPRGTTSAVCS